jgi:hypothetical protein
MSNGYGSRWRAPIAMQAEVGLLRGRGAVWVSVGVVVFASSIGDHDHDARREVRASPG